MTDSVKNQIDGHDNAASQELTRRSLLKSAAAGAAALAFAQLGCSSAMSRSSATAASMRNLANGSEDVQRILDVTATVERFGVTFLGAGLQAQEQGRYDKPWPADVVAVVKAARAQEQFHLDFFLEAGGRPMVDTFTIPPEALSNFNTFFSAIVEQETLEVAAQLAAMDAYAALKRPDLAKVSFQYAAEEAEHRVLANYTRGARPAIDIAFAPRSLATTSAIIDNMRQRGLIGGAGVAVAFPGPGAIDASNVTNRRPDGPSA